MSIDFSDRNNARSGKKTHVRDERLGCSPVTTVEPLPQMPRQANCLRHAGPKLIPRKTAFEDKSSCEKPFQKVFGILLGLYGFKQAENFVLVVLKTSHPPCEERQFARLQFVEYVDENSVNHNLRTTRSSSTLADWRVSSSSGVTSPRGKPSGDAAR